MTSETPEGIALTVRGAEKRDAGRGVARLTEAARRELGLLSGDAVVVEGRRATVAKVWPARSGLRDDAVRIDADTRSNADVTIGDTVHVRPETVESARSVTIVPPRSLTGVDHDVLKRAVSRHVRGRPVSEGERFTLERVTDEAFHVTATTPDGPVRVTEDTTVSIVPPRRGGDGDSTTGGTSGAATGSGRSGDAGADSDTGGAAEAPSGGSDATGSGDASGWNADGAADDEAGEASDAVQFRQPAAERGTVSYEDIGGLDDELEQVREMIELPLNEPELFQRLGVDPPKGVLLYGPPGTGKTLIAKAVANEVDATFFSVDGPEIVSKFKGESEEQLRRVFEEAGEHAPAVIFFDEIDSVAAQREESGGLENRIVAQLLSLMDGLDAREDVVVIGATNRVDVIDPALRRGGRFDREIEIGVPDEGGRREIFDVHTRNMPLATDVGIDSLASRTHGFVGADVDALVTEAAMYALRRVREADADPGSVEVTKADFDRALASVDPSGMREFVSEKPSTRYDDVGGLEDAKQVLRETVEWPLAYDRLFTETATEPPSGVLLYGPPGTGKTLLARALAGETDVNFVHVDGPELVDKYVGESEKAVREVFNRARQGAPSIVFLDEVDALVGRRGEGTNEVTERVVSQLLTELDGLRENPNLVVIGATNRKEDIDPALLRPGRIDTHVEVGVPEREGREKILEVHTRGKPLADDVDLDELAAALTDYTGADLEAIAREASMIAIREFAEEHGPAEANERAGEIEIGRDHVDRAVAAVDRTLDDYPQYATE